MVKILVLYHSKTGNTEKMAEFIAEGAREEKVDVSLKKVQEIEVEDLLNIDGIIVGSPTYYGGMAAEIKYLFDESVKFHGKFTGKVGAAFSSSALVGGGNETTILSILQAMLIHGMIIAGDASGNHYGPVSIGAPDKKSEEECKSWGRKTAKLALKLKSN